MQPLKLVEIATGRGATSTCTSRREAARGSAWSLVTVAATRNRYATVTSLWTQKPTLAASRGAVALCAASSRMEQDGV